MPEKIPWTEKPGGLQYIGVARELDTTEQLNNNNNAHVCTENVRKEVLRMLAWVKGLWVILKFIPFWVFLISYRQRVLF